MSADRPYRTRFRGTLVARTGLRFGGVLPLGPAAHEDPLARDADGRPLVPGSALRGALRWGLERTLAALGSERGPELSAATQRLFGQPSKPGLLQVGDLRAAPGTALSAELRCGGPIDRATGQRRSGRGFRLEVIPAGARFELELLLESAGTLDRALCLAGLDLLHEGVVRLGAGRARGLGRVEVQGLKVEELSPLAALKRGDWASLQLTELRGSLERAVASAAGSR